MEQSIGTSKGPTYLRNVANMPTSGSDTWQLEARNALRAAADLQDSLEEQVQTLLAATRAYEDGVRKSLISASGAWNSGYAAAKDQYSGYGIDLAKMADAMYQTVGAGVDHQTYMRLASAALHYIEKQADA